jgi:hypothetical protein
MKTRYFSLIAIGILGIMAVSATLASVPACGGRGGESEDKLSTSISGNGDGTNDLPHSNLDPGDIIILANPGNFFDYIIPGEYGHGALFAGYVQQGQYIWDRDNDSWMDPGTPYVIHAAKHEGRGNGLGYGTFQEAINDHADVARSLEVEGLSEAEKQQALDYLTGELDGGSDGYPIGPKYDWGWTGKQVDGDTRSPVSLIKGYYCTEAVWAAYMGGLGVQIDEDGWGWDWQTAYGVSADDIWHDSDTATISVAD